ncbi:MAG: glycosyltransferase [Deltaproteobacteria bacterium]|jgi:tetratricopeptide (TPR) repeat protein|nr:glycosyltransferase [Deltaproteobacteria bacterium]
MFSDDFMQDGWAGQRFKTGPSGPTLGLAMIMKNEANNLPYSLGPLAGLLDEMVVVDTGSTDASAEMAAAYGAKVVHTHWNDDFSQARNFGLDFMTTDFILWLDADNSLTVTDLAMIRDRLGSGGLIFTATEVVVPQGDRLWQKRVFANSPEARFQGRIHEQLTHPPEWPVVHTPAEIRHWGYADGKQAREKGHRNLQLLISDPQTAAGDFYHLYQTGRTLFNLRYFKEAKDYLNGAAEAGLLGTGLSEAGQAENVLLESPSLWSHSLILLSQTHQRLGDYALAEECLRYLCRARPGYGPGRAYLGRLLAESGRNEECVSQLTKALALGCGDPGWGADHRKLGFVSASLLAKANATLGRHREARKAWEEAVRLNPEHPEPYVALAESLITEGDTPKARLLLAEAIRLSPTHRRALNMEASL